MCDRGVDGWLELTLVLVLLFVCGSAASAQQPIDVQGVPVGRATVETAGSSTTIRASDGAVINYHRFGVPQGSSVEFVQPGPTSRVLNRIVGGEPTRIDGSLTANGIVYLVNPAGVMFGAGSVVDVGGIVAAAGRMTDADFAAGLDRLVTSNAVVENAGEIRAGAFAHLIGRAAHNSGSIVSRGGVVTMSSGGDVYLSELGRGLRVEVDAYPAHGPLEDGHAAGVTNTGVIEAGEVALSSGDLYSLALESAGGIRSPGGAVRLSGGGHARVGGVIDVSGGGGVRQAGLIDVHARTASLNGKLRAIGEQGGYVSFTSDLSTLIVEGVLIDVSGDGARGIGDAGEVLVHAYGGDTRFEKGARVDVSGGALGGDGGAMEISSANRLHVEGEIDAWAAPGFERGRILFDPLDILIETPGVHDPNLASGQILRGQGAGEVWTISPSAIENSFGTVTLEATRDIWVNEGVDAPFGGLLLDAGRDINVNAPLFAGSVELMAGRDINAAMGAGATWTLDLIAGGNIVTGDLSALFVNVDAGGGLIGVGSPELTAGITLEVAGSEIAGFSRFGGGFQAIVDGPVTLTENLTASGAFGVTWRGPVDGEAGSRRDLTVEGPAFFERAVGGVVPLGAVDVQGQATLRGAGIFAVENVMLDGILLARHARIEGHDILIDGSVNSGNLGPFDLELGPTGVARFERMVGEVSALRSLAVEGDLELSRYAGIAAERGIRVDGRARIDGNAGVPIMLDAGVGTLSLGSLDGGALTGGASLAGASVRVGDGVTAVDLDGDLSITSGEFEADGAIRARDVSVDASGIMIAGDMDVADAVLESGGVLTLNGDLAADTARLSAGGTLALSGELATGDLAIDASEVAITGGIDAGALTIAAGSARVAGDLEVRSLHVRSDGDVHLVGDVRTVVGVDGGGPYAGLAPGSVLLSGETVTLGGTMVAERIGIEGALLIEGPVRLEADRLVAAGSIDGVDELASLVIDAEARLNGSVGSVRPPASFSSLRGLELGGDVIAGGGIDFESLVFAGDRRIESLGGGLSLGAIDGLGALTLVGSEIGLEGDVGSLEAPASLELIGPRVMLDSDRVSVSGPVGLTGDLMLTRRSELSGSGVTIAGGVSGPFDLRIDAGGAVRIDGGVDVSGVRISAETANLADAVARSIVVDAESIRLSGMRYQAEDLDLAFDTFASSGSATLFLPEELIDGLSLPGVQLIPLRNGEPAGSLAEVLGVDGLARTLDLPAPMAGVRASGGAPGGALGLAPIQERAVAPDIRSALVEEDN